MIATATQFAAHCVGLHAYPPPNGIADAPLCWLCGGETHGQGWPLRDAIQDTFCNHNQAKAPASNAVCWPCVAMAAKSTWDAHVAAHPDRGLKIGRTMSWRSYSHVFAHNLHDSPNRERWRGWLLEPPEPPFLFIMATSGQKHLIFRGGVAQSRDLFPVQFEDEATLVDRAQFKTVLADMEALYALGFSKDSIVSGEYHHGQLLKVGLSAWRPLEEKIAIHRRLSPGLLRIAHFCAQKPEETP